MSKFKVDIALDKYSGHMVSVTHNGYQWSTICFDDLELLEIARDRINEYLESKQGEVK